MIWKIALGILVWILLGVVWMFAHWGDAKGSYRKKPWWEYPIDWVLMAPIMPLAYLFGWIFNSENKIIKSKPVQWVFGCIYVALVMPIAYAFDKLNK